MLPVTSSERRDYVPIGWLNPPNIPSISFRIIENASLVHFAILTSSMHMTWLRHVGGRLESRFSYSIGVVYNTFPVPFELDVNRKVIEPLAKKILAVRKKFKNSTLAELYDPELMPTELKSAHFALDQVIERLYRRKKFTSDFERFEYLLKLYGDMTTVNREPSMI